MSVMNEAELRTAILKILYGDQELVNSTDYSDDAAIELVRESMFGDKADSLLDLYRENERVARIDEQMRTEIDNREIVVRVDFPYLLSGHMIQADRISELSNTHKTEAKELALEAEALGFPQMAALARELDTDTRKTGRTE